MQENNLESVLQLFKCVTVSFFRHFVCFQFNKMVSPNLNGRCACESQGFVMIGDFSASNFGGASGLFRSSYHLRSVALASWSKNTLTKKWLQSFWNAHDDPLSAIRNVKVNIGYEPSAQVQCESVRQRFVSLKHCCDKKHNVLDPNGTSEDMAGRRG